MQIGWGLVGWKTNPIGIFLYQVKTCLVGKSLRLRYLIALAQNKGLKALEAESVLFRI